MCKTDGNCGYSHGKRKSLWGKTHTDGVYPCKAVILATGVYLNPDAFVERQQLIQGRMGFRLRII